MGVSGGGRAPAVHRAASLLGVLAFERRARPADLARAVGLPKSSASDLIGTLLEERMLARAGDDLVLGNALIELAAGYVGDIATLRRFGIGWERSALLREHTVTLRSLVGAHGVCVSVRLGAHVLPYTPRAGSRLPLWYDAPEPVLAVVPLADIARALDEFPEDGPAAQALSRWVETATGGRREAASATPALSATGNLELSSSVSSGAERGGPVVVTAHLPPASAVDADALQAALDEFAHDLRPPEK